jgi:hypothetical protein
MLYNLGFKENPLHTISVLHKAMTLISHHTITPRYLNPKNVPISQYDRKFSVFITSMHHKVLEEEVRVKLIKTKLL